MKKICLQSGHKGIYVGATGAPGERDWNSKVVPKIATILRERGCEVYETDANGYQDNIVTDTDWDLFLAVHYDADIYNDRGGFVDFPEPSTDYATLESQRIQKELSDHYFKTTGIPVRPSRSNANTRYYYMWQYLTADTPCNLIECGVGWRRPEDYETLHNHIDMVAKAIADGICLALGVNFDMSDCEQQLEETTELMIKYKTERDEKDAKLEQCREERAKCEADAKKHIEELQKTLSLANEAGAKTALELESCKKERDEAKAEVDTLKSTKSSLESKVQALEGKLKLCQEEKITLTNDLTECEKKYRTKLCKVSLWEFLKKKAGCK